MKPYSINVWRESELTPWFWEVYFYDEDDPRASGIASSEREAEREADAAGRRLCGC